MQIHSDEYNQLRQILENALHRLGAPQVAPPPVPDAQVPATDEVLQLQAKLAGMNNEVGWLGMQMLEIGKILGHTGKMDGLVTHAKWVMAELNSLRS